MTALRGTPLPRQKVCKVSERNGLSLDLRCGAVRYTAVVVVFGVGLVSSHTSTVREICALTNLDDIAVRIADVAAYLAVLGDRFCDELGSSAFP